MDCRSNNGNKNVEVISKEFIKPFSSTPDHLKKLKLSLIDQLSPRSYITFIFFYEAHELKSSNNHTQISQQLKQSLSTTLTQFYPLAGRMDSDNMAVNCDDSGVGFIEARSHVRLSDVVKNPTSDQLQHYLPVDAAGCTYIEDGAPLMMAQFNLFTCGGIAIGVCISHLLADGWSMVEFMNAWAATCRGDESYDHHQLEFGVIARHFPARQDLVDLNISPSMFLGKEKFVTKRFVFDKEKLAALKQTANKILSTSGQDFVKDPTRVEVVSAFIWKFFVEKKVVLEGIMKKFIAAHAVNIRSRTNQSLHLEHAFGNGCLGAYAMIDLSNKDKGVMSCVPQLHEVVLELRRAIRNIDDEYIRKGSCDADFLLSVVSELFRVVLEREGEAFVFSSWCRFPVYEVEFGWGNPVWVCTTSFSYKDLAILMSTKDGDGIEAWINLPSDNIESFQNQFDLIGVSN